MAQIDDFAGGNLPVLDITGKLIEVDLFAENPATLAPKNLGQPQPLDPNDPLLNLDQDTIQLLTTPLSASFDRQWNGDNIPHSNQQTDPSDPTDDGNENTGPIQKPHPPGKPDNSGKAPTVPPEPPRQQMIEKVWEELSAQTKKYGGVKPSGTAGNPLGTEVPYTGKLRALVIKENIVFLSYEIRGNVFRFISTKSEDLGFPAEWSLTFDLAILTRIEIPPQPGPLDISTSVQVFNTHMEAENSLAENIDLVIEFIDDLLNKPSFISSIEGETDQSGNTIPSPDSATLKDQLGKFSDSWVTNARKYGFRVLKALTRDATLVFQLEHPLDPAPVLVNRALDPFPNFFGPTISTVPEAQAGQTIQVLCVNFPIAQSNQIILGWTDTTSGVVLESIVTWGQFGGTQRVFPIIRVNDLSNLKDPSANNIDFFVADNLSPNTQYSFVVQDRDLFTITEPSSPTVIRTSASDEVSFFLVRLPAEWPLGTAIFARNGSFNAMLTIPAGVATGVWTLVARLGNQNNPSTQIQIVAQGDAPIPVITIPDGGRFFPGTTFSLKLAGFLPGDVNLFVDSPAGALLARVSSPGPQAFDTMITWPVDDQWTGNHNIYAQDMAMAQPPATCPVDVLADPK